MVSCYVKLQKASSYAIVRGDIWDQMDHIFVLDTQGARHLVHDPLHLDIRYEKDSVGVLSLDISFPSPCIVISEFDAELVISMVTQKKYIYP